ncbi:MAG: hypothetical protein U9N81_12955 [Bacillota bacterium]|nr:hypothetical protein [Bacillota bacterium]
MRKVIAGILAVVFMLALCILGWKILNPGFTKVPADELTVPDWKASQKITNPDYEDYADEYDIVRSTDELGGTAEKYYSKYINYTAPNGKPICLLAMNEVNDEQLLYAYDMLSFYLTSTDKIDKNEIANRMAEKNAVLILPNGADRDGKTPLAAMTLGQNLNYAEIANVGSKWYIDCDFTHRDASFEEIFHLVHDNGIGTTQNPGAAPEITQIIANAMINASPGDSKDWGEKGLWALKAGRLAREWEKEGSLEQEYIAAVIDCYYGIWEPWTEGEGSMWGSYVAKNRAEIARKDPVGKAALESFLTENITRMMRVDPSFTGDFIMEYDKTLPYTAKSQYLQCIALQGANDSNITANDLDNVLMGNSGSNKIDGRGGNDTVQFRGSSDEYKIESTSNGITVNDTVIGRDGAAELRNIETLRFTDRNIAAFQES